MTTAHRPTFRPAKGGDRGEQSGGRMYVASGIQASRDQPSQTRIKFREGVEEQSFGEAGSEAARLEMRARLEAKERGEEAPAPLTLKRSADEAADAAAVPALAKAPVFKRAKLSGAAASRLEALSRLDEDSDSSDSDSDSDSSPEAAERRRAGAGADSSDSESSDSESDSDSDSDSDGEADERALMLELEKIKQAKQAAEKRSQDEQAQRDAIAEEAAVRNSNPLMRPDEDVGAEDYTIKRKWYEETVFRNQARAVPKQSEQFINDPTRNNFHKDFMDRFIK
jgi:protein CWC15